MPRTEAELRRLAEQQGLSRLWPLIRAELRPCVRMTLTRVRDDGAIALGASKAGGDPDLPTKARWPKSRRGDALSFLVQIDLAALPRTPATAPLPERGLLSFFYEVLGAPTGADPGDRGRFKVLYSDMPKEALGRRPAPTEDDTPVCDVFEPCAAKFQPATSPLANWDFPPEAEDRDAYEPIAHPKGGEPVHQLFGNPGVVQEPMERRCELVAKRKISLLDEDGSSPALLKKAPEQLRQEWVLLLQLDGDRAPGFRWGDDGRLFFWIAAKDLERRRFEEAWVILQSS